MPRRGPQDAARAGALPRWSSDASRRVCGHPPPPSRRRCRAVTSCWSYFRCCAAAGGRRLRRRPQVAWGRRAVVASFAAGVALWLSGTGVLMIGVTWVEATLTVLWVLSIHPSDEPARQHGWAIRRGGPDCVLAECLREPGLYKVADTFDWERNTDRLLRVFSEVCSPIGAATRASGRRGRAGLVGDRACVGSAHLDQHRWRLPKLAGHRPSRPVDVLSATYFPRQTLGGTVGRGGDLPRASDLTSRTCLGGRCGGPGGRHQSRSGRQNLAFYCVRRRA